MELMNTTKSMKSWAVTGITAIHRFERTAGGGGFGAVAGAALGASAGPPGAIAGAILGGIVGAMAGKVLDGDALQREERTREFDAGSK
jgi:phage tail tape-measure protein